eukprot:GEMP01085345.1.p1 GENE.GEMP01085345.1~~GEMP01085345.1.p1  ORF type:complete len:202 (+),score=37.11 GEMP01085345.1:235-840(+)
MFGSNSVCVDRSVALSAYYCVTLFEDSWDVAPSDLQEQTNGPCGRGIYLTTDLEKCLAHTNKSILVVEFGAQTPEESFIDLNDFVLGETDSADWRERGYAGVLYQGTELCISMDVIRCIYRRDWPATGDIMNWSALAQLMHKMAAPPLQIDSNMIESASGTSWHKALERLRDHGDEQVKLTKTIGEQAWTNKSDGSSCTIH